MKSIKTYDSGARVVMLLAGIFILISLLQLGYRYTLPTDGWDIYTEEISETVWIYDKNLVGAESNLRQGDKLLVVEGTSVVGTATSELLTRPDKWRSGQQVTLIVSRDGTRTEVAVPVVHWTAAALIQANILNPAKLSTLLGAIILLLVGWFTFLKRPDVLSARALLFLSTAMAASMFSRFLPDGLSVQFDPLAYYLTVFFSYIIFGTVIAPALFTFSLLFPRPKQLVLKHRWIAILPAGYGALLLPFLLFGGPAEVGWLSTLALFALSMISFIHAGFSQNDPVSKAQLRWAISSLILGIAFFMLNFPLNFGWFSATFLVNLVDFVQSLGIAVIGLGMSVAILRYRLYDIDVIIRKTLIYAFLTATLALIYFGMVVVLQTIIGRAAGEQSPLIIVISTLLIAALFSPLRRRVQSFIDRRFYRRKYDATQILAQFANTARDEVDMEKLSAVLIRVIEETVEPEHSSLWLNVSERLNLD
ncbi:MAG: hypothetical protein WAM60_24710 [Candidatus Promineifilaceae bacterium]